MYYDFSDDTFIASRDKLGYFWTITARSGESYVFRLSNLNNQTVYSGRGGRGYGYVVPRGTELAEPFAKLSSCTIAESPNLVLRIYC